MIWPKKKGKLGVDNVEEEPWQGDRGREGEVKRVPRDVNSGEGVVRIVVGVEKPRQPERCSLAGRVVVEGKERERQRWQL